MWFTSLEKKYTFDMQQERMFYLKLWMIDKSKDVWTLVFDWTILQYFPHWNKS